MIEVHYRFLFTVCLMTLVSGYVHFIYYTYWVLMLVTTFMKHTEIKRILSYQQEFANI